MEDLIIIELNTHLVSNDRTHLAEETCPVSIVINDLRKVCALVDLASRPNQTCLQFRDGRSEVVAETYSEVMAIINSAIARRASGDVEQMPATYRDVNMPTHCHCGHEFKPGQGFYLSTGLRLCCRECAERKDGENK